MGAAPHTPFTNMPSTPHRGGGVTPGNVQAFPPFLQNSAFTESEQDSPLQSAANSQKKLVFPPAGVKSFKNSRKNSPKNLKQLFISRDKLCGMISDAN